MLTTGELYRDLGGDYFSKRDPDAKPDGSSPSSNASATRSPSGRRRRLHDGVIPEALSHAG